MLQSTAQGELPIQNLTTLGKKAYVLKDLNTSLISLGHLADDGCTIVLTKKQLQVFKNYKKIIQGFRNKTDGLWDIPLNNKIPSIINTKNPKLHKLNVIIPKNQQIKDLVQYMHATLFSPTKKTLIQVISNGNFIGCTKTKSFF